MRAGGGRAEEAHANTDRQEGEAAEACRMEERRAEQRRGEEMRGESRLMSEKDRRTMQKEGRGKRHKRSERQE